MTDWYHKRTLIKYVNLSPNYPPPHDQKGAAHKIRIWLKFSYDTSQSIEVAESQVFIFKLGIGHEFDKLSASVRRIVMTNKWPEL